MKKLVFTHSPCPRQTNITVNGNHCLDCKYCFGFDEEGLLICTYEGTAEESEEQRPLFNEPLPMSSEKILKKE